MKLGHSVAFMERLYADSNLPKSQGDVEPSMKAKSFALLATRARRRVEADANLIKWAAVAKWQTQGT